ncbi:MAG: hypothetical protein NTY35_12135 [Planctomycetota bacterium]|nr:hypothetical protein [Planctomycetota bacterium]
MSSHKPLLLALGLAACATVAQAQSFNLDVGANQTHPLPANSYGAAAGQTGQWFGVSTTTPVFLALTDINGVATSATLTWTGGTGDFAINNPAWNGGDDLLMEDATDINGIWNGFGTMTWTFTGLAAGTYDVYTYAAAPDFPASYNTRVAVTGAPEAAQTCTGAWAGSPHVQGVSYARHTATVVAGGLLVIVTDDPGTIAMNYATVNGFQLKFTPGAIGTYYCPGDGSGSACPCGNNSATGAGLGCLNSLNLGGRITATGNAILANDTVLLTGSGMPNSSALYFQGTNQQSGGLGAVFGDGLRCAGGTVVRLGTKNNVSGGSTYPAAGDPTVSVRGGITAPGTRTYQCWYRNAAAFCTASTFNLSNGVELTWAP